MDNTIRINRVAVLAAGLAAVAASVAVGTAFGAPPIRNAERKCVDAGGQFTVDATQYRCDGLGRSAVMTSADRQCRHSYKGWAFSWWQDPTTGQWSYICSLPV
jgi:YD repeat-containing protein